MSAIADQIVELFTRKNADGKPRFTPAQIREFVPVLVLLSQTPADELPEELQTQLMALALVAGVKPDDDDERVSQALVEYFRRNPLPKDLANELATIFKNAEQEFDASPEALGKLVQNHLQGGPAKHVPIKQKSIWGDE